MRSNIITAVAIALLSGAGGAVIANADDGDDAMEAPSVVDLRKDDGGAAVDVVADEDDDDRDPAPTGRDEAQASSGSQGGGDTGQEGASAQGGGSGSGSSGGQAAVAPAPAPAPAPVEDYADDGYAYEDAGSGYSDG